jgi:hypothetical protein
LELCACASLRPAPPTPISQVIEASKGGAPETVIAKMKSSRTIYAPRGSDYGKLADLGVQPPVLDYLQQSFVSTVDLLTRYWVLAEGLGNCTWCYPQVLDLSNLSAGGNGMSPHQPTGSYYGARPPGLPDWIPYPPGTALSNRRITVDQIVEKSKQGTPADQLVAEIRTSQLEHVIGVGGVFKVGTTLTAGVGGAQLAALRKDGVPDPVLDAIQDQFLQQYVEFARLHWQAIGKPHGGGAFF